MSALTSAGSSRARRHCHPSQPAHPVAPNRKNMMAGCSRETSWPVRRWLSPPGPASAGDAASRGVRPADRAVSVVREGVVGRVEAVRAAVGLGNGVEGTKEG